MNECKKQDEIQITRGGTKEGIDCNIETNEWRNALDHSDGVRNEWGPLMERREERTPPELNSAASSHIFTPPYLLLHLFLPSFRDYKLSLLLLGAIEI